jgi:hypothetical protein
MTLKIFLDDERDAPPDFVRTRSVAATIELLELNVVTELSLDNDLGEGLPEGYKVADYILNRVVNDNTYNLPQLMVHSQNPVRRKYMLETFRRIYNIL